MVVEKSERAAQVVRDRRLSPAGHGAALNRGWVRPGMMWGNDEGVGADGDAPSNRVPGRRCKNDVSDGARFEPAIADVDIRHLVGEDPMAVVEKMVAIERVVVIVEPFIVSIY